MRVPSDRLKSIVFRKKVDYLIIGKGIAGTVISFLLLREGKNFVVVDRPDIASASSVSAGICNPVVFRKLTTSWKIKHLLAASRQLYGEFESLLGVSLIKNKEILRIFTSAEERKLWEKKLGDPDLMDYITIPETTNMEPFIQAPYGTGKVMQSMQVDMEVLLPEYHQLLENEQRLVSRTLDHDEIEVTNEEVIWNDITAKRIIFCEGYDVLSNPYFDWLPLKPVKGETLIIRSSEIPPTFLLNKKIILCPLGNNLFWAGATYNWKDLNNDTTANGRQELISMLDKLLKVPYEIVEQKAGVRPAVRDRRPLLGVHPEHKNLFVFNGLGTKGTMLAPYLAPQLLDLMDNGIQPESEVNIERFYRFRQESTNESG